MFLYLNQVLSHFEWAWNHTDKRQRAYITFKAFAYCVAIWVFSIIAGFSASSLHFTLVLGFSIGTLTLGFVVRFTYINASRQIWQTRATQGAILTRAGRRLNNMGERVCRNLPHLKAKYEQIVYCFDRQQAKYDDFADNYPLFLLDPVTLDNLLTNIESLNADLEEERKRRIVPSPSPVLTLPNPVPASATRMSAKVLAFPGRQQHPATSAH